MNAAELVGARFSTEWGEGVVTGPVPWSDAYVAVRVGTRETCRRIADLHRFFGHAGDPDPSGRFVATERSCTVTPAKTRKQKGLNDLSRTGLQKKLLETPTISDGAWRAYREANDLPERDKGESREAFIRRVLA